ncbi:MAG: hypothetical protein ACM3XM_08270 [Mycobacterium leprae]
MANSITLRCILCGRLDTVYPGEAAYDRSQSSPTYKHICRVCGGSAGREAQQVTGLNPEMVDAMDKFVRMPPRR